MQTPYQFVRLRFLATLLVLGLLGSSCTGDDPFYADLAYLYAPVHYQDTDDTDEEADFITRVDYDDNWTATDNWENLASGDLSAWVYYSVVESCTHWFIIYAFFHPRDWSDDTDDEHENDMEGLLAIIRQDGSEFGELQGVITVFHEDFFSFTTAGSPLTDGEENIYGELSLQSVNGSLHPKTSQEAKGHGIKAWSFAGDFQGNDDEDGIIYFPSRTSAMVPSSGNDRNVNYRLVDLTAFGNLWTLQILEANRDRENAKTFATWGTLKGDEGGGCGDGLFVDCTEDSANLPWDWDDEDDGPTFAGEWALDPAHLADHYFDGVNFSQEYLRNKYLADLQKDGYDPDFLPRGWPVKLKLAEMYNKLTTTCPE